MGEVLENVFKDYDTSMCGELEAEQLQRLYGDLRMGGLSLPQVEAAISYTCLTQNCMKSELFDSLQELDRRYFLLQGLRWEFSMLDRDQTDTISEDQARWLVQAVHGKYFSKKKWERYLCQRAIPGSGVRFTELEVMLCDIPSRHDYECDAQLDEISRQEKLCRQREIEDAISGEKERLRQEREKEKLGRDEEEKEKHRKQLEDEDRLRSEEADWRRRLQEEEEAREAGRLMELEKQHREEEARRRAEEERYHNVEHLATEEARKEKAAEQELKDAQKRKQNAKDGRNRKEAEADEQNASARKTEHKRRRIRYDLKVAIKSRDKFRLDHSIKEFRGEKLDDNEMDLAKAEKLLRELTAGDYLRKAMTDREIEDLEKAMETVRKHGFEVQLAQEMMAANKLLGRLRRLERIRHEILELKQATVAEIRSYQNPPLVVHTVMTCTFLLLGHMEKETQSWKAIQALVGKTGKESLKRRCLGCDPGSLNMAAVMRAKTLLDKHQLEEVRDVSAGAATFYVWAIAMIEEAIEVAKQKEEDKRLGKEMNTSKPQSSIAPSSTPSSTSGSRLSGQKPRSRSTGSSSRQPKPQPAPQSNSIQDKMNKVAASRQNPEDKTYKQVIVEKRGNPPRSKSEPRSVRSEQPAE